jgi:hypothetical protein
MSAFSKKRKQPAEPQEARFEQGELAAALRPLVMPPDRLPAGVAEGAPAALPGLVMATAVRIGDQVNFVPVSAMASLGGPQTVWAQAMRNVENFDGFDVVREEIDADRTDTTLVTVAGDDPFVASRVVVLDWVTERVHEGSASHGVLVTVPALGKLVLHVVSGAGVLRAVEHMALVASHWFQEAGEQARISPDVYLVSPDRRAQRVAYPAPDGRITINTTGLFGEILFTPAPHGLGLQA